MLKKIGFFLGFLLFYLFIYLLLLLFSCQYKMVSRSNIRVFVRTRCLVQSMFDKSSQNQKGVL
jgi:hypothetical protein